MRSAVVLGGSGFVGSKCVIALQAAGWNARSESTPRLTTSVRAPGELTKELARHTATIDSLSDVLGSADVVINSGGIAVSNAPDSDDLFGANAILPGVISLAARQSGVRRFIHLSSILVQDRMDPLDETMRHCVKSPYSASRSLGERILAGPDHDHAVILRLPSVHAPGRSATRKLSWVARSPLSSTAGRGDRPTPLVLLENVAGAVEFLAAYEGKVPKVVLPPAEGITTGRVLELLGGRMPRHIPVSFAKPVTSLLLLAGRLSPHAYTLGRRLEIMWFGQGQGRNWMTEAGYVAPVGAEGWEAIGRALRSR